MSRIEAVPSTTPVDDLPEVFREIEETFGMVPNLFRTYARHPPLLKANWHKVKAVMMEGTLSPQVKQTIAVLVSRDNSCAYCVAAHTGALLALGLTREEIAALSEDLERSAFSSKEKALITFARKANQSPLRIEDAEFAALRHAGASDAEIPEALGVMELFTAFNKFLDSLQVDIDF